MEETIFQKIINKEIPANIVYETEESLAFLDIKPVNKGHTLVIPKKPAKDIFDLVDVDTSDLMRTIVLVSRAVKEVTGAPGINVISNNGSAAGQEVFHLHFHIIPRLNRYEFKPVPHTAYDDSAEMDRYAKNIMDYINRS